ncbi:MAG: hypothetical protein AB1942_03835 [Pseudomonadota bacterium]
MSVDRLVAPSRRGVLRAVGAGALAAGATPALAASDAASGPARAADLQAILDRYAGFGIKASGGDGDTRCGAWIEATLGALGYRCERQMFEAPYFEARAATLSVGGAEAGVFPQAIVVTTADGVSAPLRRPDAGQDLNGAIAYIDLPPKRWVTLLDPQVRAPLEDALRRGAAAVVLVTHGVTGEAIALNVSPHHPGYPKPVVILAPKDAAAFAKAADAGGTATLVVAGRGGRRPAFNVIARLDRKAEKTLIVTTPRSGWFVCAAERGSGFAVWMDLARRLAAEDLGVNLEFAANSGHEYEFLGGEHYLERAASKPQATRLWVHIGACAAARDWHEFGGRLRPLPSADPQRVMTASPALLPAVSDAFRGLPGLEAVYAADARNVGGELVNVQKAGYERMIGLYGAHRYFHTAGDDLRCTSGELVKPVAEAFHKAVLASLR